MKTTSLETSQAIKELEITQPCEKYWVHWDKKQHPGYTGNEWTVVVHTAHRDCDSIPAYTLSELPSVLQAAGEKKTLLWKGYEPEAWLYHFLNICEKHARGEDWDEYLYELVTRR